MWVVEVHQEGAEALVGFLEVVVPMQDQGEKVVLEDLGFQYNVILAYFFLGLCVDQGEQRWVFFAEWVMVGVRTAWMVQDCR